MALIPTATCLSSWPTPTYGIITATCLSSWRLEHLSSLSHLTVLTLTATTYTLSVGHQLEHLDICLHVDAAANRARALLAEADPKALLFCGSSPMPSLYFSSTFRPLQLTR